MGERSQWPYDQTERSQSIGERPPDQQWQEFLQYRIVELELSLLPIEEVVLAVEHQSTYSLYRFNDEVRV